MLAHAFQLPVHNRLSCSVFICDFLWHLHGCKGIGRPVQGTDSGQMQRKKHAKRGKLTRVVQDKEPRPQTLVHFFRQLHHEDFPVANLLRVLFARALRSASRGLLNFRFYDPEKQYFVIFLK